MMQNHSNDALASSQDLCSTPSIESAGWKKVSKKVLKDPSAPKRPMSAFMLYANAERPKILTELGNISVGQVGKELGRRWGLLDDATKEKFKTAYEEEKSRYVKEKENYQPSVSFLKKKAEMVRIKEESNRADMVEYFTFLQCNWRKTAEENKGMGAKELQEIIWQMWCKGRLSKKMKKQRNPAQPKRPLSAYFIFQQQMREELSKSSDLVATNKEVLGMIAEKWKYMDQDMRSEYENQAAILKVGYEKEMAVFLKDNNADAESV